MNGETAIKELVAWQADEGDQGLSIEDESLNASKGWSAHEMFAKVKIKRKRLKINLKGDYARTIFNKKNAYSFKYLLYKTMVKLIFSILLNIILVYSPKNCSGSLLEGA